MRKYFTIFLTIAIIMAFSACSSSTDTSKALPNEGIAPYKLSESDTYLLQTLGLDASTNIISFNAPENVKSVKFSTYVLGDDSTWTATGGGQVSSGIEDNPDASLQGAFAMLLKEDDAIDFIINTPGSRASYHVDTPDVNNFKASTKGFLTDFQEIEINKEIPVAIMIYDSGTTMRSYAVEDYFSPSKFKGMDLVQVVTLTFTDKTV